MHKKLDTFSAFLSQLRTCYKFTHLSAECFCCW